MHLIPGNSTRVWYGGKQKVDFLIPVMVAFLLFFSGTGTSQHRPPAATAVTGNCDNPRLAEAEKAAAEQRDRQIKEIERRHDEAVTNLENGRKERKLAMEKVAKDAITECKDDPPCTIETQKISALGMANMLDSCDRELEQLQQKEKNDKETAREAYTEAMRKARTLYPNAYKAGQDEFFSGTICSLAKPFEVTATAAALNIKVPYHFVPQTDSTGKFTFSFNYKGASSKGGGTYRVQNPNSCNPSLIFGGDITSGAAGISHTGSGETTLQLLPIESCNK